MDISKSLLRFFILLSIILVFIPCIQHGMFLDGVNYANVANNLANGKGSIWHFSYSETFLNHYTHQLPLMIWCEALFFYFFGDSTLVERFFCLVMLTLNAVAIQKLWTTSFPKYRAWSGLPLVFWIITPIVFWGFANNVQEMMMSLCAMISVTFVLKHYETDRKLHLVLGGLWCFLCFFCKGVQGLFPLISVPLYYWCVSRVYSSKWLIDLFYFVLPIAIFSSLLIAFEPSRAMLEANFQDRLQSTFLTTTQNTTSHRLHIVGALFMELLVSLSMCLILWFVLRKKTRITTSVKLRKGIFLIIVGLSASLPLILTLEQRRFYLITSIPFFIVAFAGFIVPLLPYVLFHKSRIRFLNLLIIVGITFALTLGVLQHESYKRDEVLLRDVHAIGKITPESTISADSELMFDFSLIAYLARHYNISLDFEGEGDYDYHLSREQILASDQVIYKGSNYHLSFIP